MAKGRFCHAPALSIIEATHLVLVAFSDDLSKPREAQDDSDVSNWASRWKLALHGRDAERVITSVPCFRSSTPTHGSKQSPLRGASDCSKRIDGPLWGRHRRLAAPRIIPTR